MQFSYNWLKRHFSETLPAPEIIENDLIFKAFEVEKVEGLASGDSIFEVKILPDRAHDCLCHRGLARELGAILNLPLSRPVVLADLKEDSSLATKVRVEEERLCRRYLAREVAGVKVGPSPKWLSDFLESIGQRSINNIVDGANFVMFDLGQPLHAFDADKVSGEIVVRLAKASEQITTLDGREIKLDEQTLIIADSVGPLAIAGIKGGNRAEVGSDTKRIILESANFDPVSIRKTSQRLSLRTDASKRFENELPRELTLEAMIALSQLLAQVAGDSLAFGPITDSNPVEQSKRKISFCPAKLAKRLDVEISAEEQIAILARLGIETSGSGDELIAEIPYWRLDLERAENLLEEIGRLNGYDKITPKLLPKLASSQALEQSGDINFKLANQLREILLSAGFSETYGYALTDSGDIALANPLASDKAFLRQDLTTGLIKKIKVGLNHLLFDDEPIKLFEIGRVFSSQAGDELRIAIGLGCRKKNKKTNLEEKLEDICKVVAPLVSKKNGFYKSDDNLLLVVEFLWPTEVAEQKIIDANLKSFLTTSNFTYQDYSPYPRIIRDVAVFVPVEVEPSLVGEIISRTVGKLLSEGPVLFDQYQKAGETKKSLAFRFALQAQDRTLLDEEANQITNQVIEALEQNNGWEVRK